jgi:hypothetical protein
MGTTLDPLLFAVHKSIPPPQNTQVHSPPPQPHPHKAAGGQHTSTSVVAPCEPLLQTKHDVERPSHCADALPRKAPDGTTNRTQQPTTHPKALQNPRAYYSPKTLCPQTLRPPNSQPPPPPPPPRPCCTPAAGRGHPGLFLSPFASGHCTLLLVLLLAAPAPAAACKRNVRCCRKAVSSQQLSHAPASAVAAADCCCCRCSCSSICCLRKAAASV